MFHWVCFRSELEESGLSVAVDDYSLYEKVDVYLPIHEGISNNKTAATKPATASGVKETASHGVCMERQQNQTATSFNKVIRDSKSSSSLSTTADFAKTKQNLMTLGLSVTTCVNSRSLVDITKKTTPSDERGIMASSSFHGRISGRSLSPANQPTDHKSIVSLTYKSIPIFRSKVQELKNSLKTSDGDSLPKPETKTRKKRTANKE